MNSRDERVLILMPTVRDGERTAQALSRAGISCTVCGDIQNLCEEIRSGAGAALLTEEAAYANTGLNTVLSAQPAWSDFPLVVLAREAREGHLLRESMNATLVERPVKVRSLLSVVRAALRARRRQYEVRDHLAERERTAEVHAYLVRLTDAIRPLSDPAAIQATTNRLLGEHLNANRVAYFEIDGTDYVIERDYAHGVAPLAGRYPVVSFGFELIDAFTAGRTVVEEDATVKTSRSPAEQAAFATINVRGHVDVPLVKDNVFVAGMTVHFSKPKSWNRDEVALIEQTAERTWAAVERAKAEQSVRENESRLRFALAAGRLGSWELDLASGTLTCSDLCKTNFGRSPASNFTYSELAEAVHPDDRERWKSTVEAAVTDGIDLDIEYRCVWPDGDVHWVLVRGRTVRDDGKPARMTGVSLDVTRRKRAEAELARLAGTLQLALDAGRLGTWEWDPVSDVMHLSRRTSEIYGAEPDVPCGREQSRRMIHPDDRERARTAAERAVVERTDYDIEYRLSERPVWVLARGRGVYDPAGNLMRTIGVVQDITQRKSTEEELRDIRARMETALEAGAIGTWSWDIPNDRFYGDASLARIFHVPADAVAGGPLAGLMGSIHPDDRERVGEHVAAVVESGGSYEADYRVTDGSGGWRWVNARGRVERDDDGKSVRFPGVVIDVTDRKRAEESLGRVTAESDRRKRLYEAVLSTTPDLAYVWGLDHRFLYANEGLLRMWGRTWDEAIGKNCLELGYEPWHAAMHDREIEEVVSTRRPVRGEVPFAGTLGRRIYDYLLMPVIGANGEVEAVAGITRDVTERQQMEQELREQDRKKDDFIALLAHELRNPLAPIRNGLQVLQRSSDVSIRVRSQEMMDRQLTHMVRMIDDLLDVSRIGRNKMELRLQRVSLADVIASAVETSQPAIDAAGHELIIAMPSKTVFLNADLTRLAQVFSNLLTNSAKYTPRGGKVWLTAETHGATVSVSVRDNGIGIPASSLPTIFDMFSQVDRSIEKSTGGLGIGLALVKGLTEMHGGKVSAVSDASGSTLTVDLPTCRDQAISTPDTMPSALFTKSHRILVVDDNRDGAESLSQLLTVMGHEVRTAFDGMEAVEVAQAYRPEVVLMDVGMPHLNGYEATRRIRANEWGRGMTIFALTGWGQEGDRLLSNEAGCDGHLVKPVSVPDLCNALKHI